MMQEFTCEHIRNVSDRLIAAARKAGAEECAVSLHGSTSSLIRYSKNQIIENGEQRSIRASLAVSIGKREATFSTSISPAVDLDAFAAHAVDLVQFFPENPEHVSPVSASPNLDTRCFDEPTSQRSPRESAEMIDAICRKVDQRNLCAYGTFTTASDFQAISNSRGLEAHHRETHVEFTVTVRTNDHSGSCRNAVSHHCFDRLAIDDTLEKTMDWAERSRNPEPIEPGDYTVIMTPTAATNYFMVAMSAFDARMVDEGRSALTHHFETRTPLDRQLFSPLITIRSRINHPDHPRAAFSQAISMDGMAGQGMAGTLYSMGLPVHDGPIVEKGVLKHLFHSLYWAEKKGIQPTGFPTLVEFESGSKSVEDLIRSTSRGLLVNSFWYIRFVDPNHLLLTGLTRDGVFLIEDGKIVRPVKNLRFNESPLSSLKNVVEVGRSERRDAWYSVVLMPALKVDGFTFSVETDAV